jgi:pSer/pThr/pTyr-binding forkhead associated (FHA) protein
MSQEENKTTRLDEMLEDLQLAEEKAREHASRPDIEEIIPWVIEFRVIGTPDIIRLPLGDRLIVGRSDTNKSINPDIDLNDYSGQKRGVSRKHARLILRDNRVMIEDLGSANGTYVNGQYINVLQPVRVRDGDHIKFGSLALQVHFVVQPSLSDETLHGQAANLNIPKLSNGQRLLILDDNKEVCTVLRFIATRAGFKPTVAHNIGAAMAHIDTGEIDALFVELILEDGNSLTVVDYARQKRNIPVVATSATTGGYREGQARNNGVQEIFFKPLAVEQIIEALRFIANYQVD